MIFFFFFILRMLFSFPTSSVKSCQQQPHLNILVAGMGHTTVSTSCWTVLPFQAGSERTLHPTPLPLLSSESPLPAMFLIYTKHIPVGCGDGGSFDLPKLLIGFIFSLRLQSRHWLCFLFLPVTPVCPQWQQHQRELPELANDWRGGGAAASF